MFVERTWSSPDGLTLSARDYAGAAGAARLPVVCLHGLTRNARDFEAVAPVLAAQGRRVLVAEMRGRGRSAWDVRPERYALPVYVQDVLALARTSGVGRAVFVGTSMGGLITAGLAAQAPDLVAAAVLNDVGPEIAPAGLRRILAYTGAAAPVRDWAEAAAYAQRINGHAFPAYRPAEWDAFARRLFRKGPDGAPVLDYDPAIAQPAAAPSGDAVAPPDLWPLFTGLADGRPTLLIRGARSDLLGADCAARLREVCPTLRFAEIPDVGHAPMLTEPAAMEALRTFLAEVD